MNLDTLALGSKIHCQIVPSLHLKSTTVKEHIYRYPGNNNDKKLSLTSMYGKIKPLMVRSVITLLLRVPRFLPKMAFLTLLNIRTALKWHLAIWKFCVSFDPFASNNFSKFFVSRSTVADHKTQLSLKIHSKITWNLLTIFELSPCIPGWDTARILRGLWSRLSLINCRFVIIMQQKIYFSSSTTFQ